MDREAQAYNKGLASTLADGINISFWFANHLLSGLKIHCSTFVLIFGFGFATGRKVRAEGALNTSAAASPTVIGNFTDHSLLTDRNEI